MNYKRDRGVTIVVLILAIILLIILVGISMSAIVGDNNILETAYEAKMDVEIATYEEELDIIGVYCSSEQINNGLSASEYINLFEEDVELDSVFENATLERETAVLLRIQTKEGYVFYVTKDGIEYKGLNGTFEEIYIITEDDVIFTYNPSSWTNETVEVSIVLDFDTGDNLFLYSFDEENWIEYTESFTTDVNTKIYVKYEADGFDSSSYVEGEVANIDTIPPLDFTPVIKRTTIGTITITGETEDGAATDTSGQSGIDHYEFSIDGGITWYDIEDSATYDKSSSDIEFTFDKLTYDTEYTVGMKAVDCAGNETTSFISASTATMPDVSEVLDIIYSPDLSEVSREIEEGWTNESVTVQIEAIDEEVAELIEDGTYIIQYKLGSEGVWTTYTKELTLNENDTISVRLSDGTNIGDEMTETIDWIDEENPDVPELTAEDVGDDYIEISVMAEDDLSGVSEYYYYIVQYELDEDGNEIEYDGVEYSSTSDTIKFEGLSYQSSYLITVTVFDLAGNESVSETMKISTGDISELYYTYDSGYEIGDYVDYSIDLDEDGDTTNDWQIFYENDDGVVFLIADYYLLNTSKYMDFDSTGIDFLSKNYVMTWSSLPTKQTIYSATNSLFMADWPYLSSSTNGNIAAISVYLNTYNWTGFVDSTYAQYAIGTPTLEMFVASWNSLGYTELIYEEADNGYGYIFGFDEDELDYYLDLTSLTAEVSGYGNTLFFPERIFDGSVNGYLLASPDAYSATASIRVQYDGGFQNSGFTNNYGGIRPVVALKSNIYLTSNEAGIVELSTEEIEIKEANMELVYEPSTWTNSSVVVTVSLNDEDLLEKIESGIYVYQYTFDDPDDENCEWITLNEFENVKITTTENGILYVRLFDGTREGEYATAYINIIDRLAPNSFTPTTEASVNNIIVAVEVTDADATDEDGCSGIATYEFSKDGGSTYTKTSDGITVYTFSDLEKGTEYYIKVRVTDNAGNITESETLYISTISQEESGDWVDYGININGNTDSTDDWRLFYVTDDATVTYDSTDTDRMIKIKTTGSGQVFLIASDYIKADNELLDLDNTGLTTYRGRNYVLFWSSVPDKAEINSTTNAIFMFNYSYASSSTKANMKVVSRLLYTEYWTNFVDSSYAEYAIGSPTLEMWVAAWNEKYGDEVTLYCDNETSTGYYVGTTSSPTTYEVSNSIMNVTSGYSDTIFYPHTTQYGVDGTMRKRILVGESVGV